MLIASAKRADRGVADCSVAHVVSELVVDLLEPINVGKEEQGLCAGLGVRV